ncbi:MAG: carboxypeptidase regulatory-like domain-containing protein, partial [Thermoplasmata archaeon]
MVFNSITKKLTTILIILLFICSALAVLPASASDSRAEQTEQNMIIKGTVFDAATGKVIPGALILLWNDKNEYKAETDENGNFKFEVPHSGYHLKATAEGYHPLEELLEKKDSTEVELKLSLKPKEPEHKPMLVLGKVFDEVTNEPIAKAVILVHNDNSKYEAVSGEDGSFKLSIPPGFYKVFVTREGYHDVETEIKGEAGNEITLSISMKPVKEEKVWVYVEGKVFVPVLLV